MSINPSCQERIRFLASFAPTTSNSGIIEETRSAPSDQHDEVNLYFDNGFSSAYAAHLENMLKGDNKNLDNRPRVIIVHGQAGDGKTSFLYHFFQDKFHYDLRNKKNLENATDEYRSYYHIQLDSDYPVKCEIYCVLDMSELLGNQKEQQKVMNDIFTIVTSRPNSETRSEANNKQTSNLNKIVILAANNGIILDFFEKKLSSAEEEYGKEDHRCSVWRKQIVEPLRQHFLSGNMSQFIFEKTKDDIDDEDDDYDEHAADNSILQLFSRDDVDDKDKDQTPHLLENKVKLSKFAQIVLFDMSYRIDQDILGRIIDSFFDKKFFVKCTQKQENGACHYANECPILKNYELLKEHDFKALKVSLSQLIDLQASNGYHINVRAILKLLSNALLGCVQSVGSKSNKERRYFDCTNIGDELNNLDKNGKLSIDNVKMKCCYLSGFYNSDENDKNKKVVFITNPYDNIFGLNLDLRDKHCWNNQNVLLEDMAYKQESIHDQYNVFRIMCKTGLGDYSSAHLDELINALLNHNTPSSWLEQYWRDKQEDNSSDNWKNNWVIKSLIDDLKKLKSEENELFEQKQNSVAYLKNDKEYKQLKQKRFAIMGSLRRAFFFYLQPQQLKLAYKAYVTACDEQNNNNPRYKEQANPNLFAISAFPHALDFLSFWRKDRNSQDNYTFVELGRDLVWYRSKSKNMNKVAIRACTRKYSKLVEDKNGTVQKLSDAMAKFLSGKNLEDHQGNRNWILFDNATDNSLVLDVQLQEDQQECEFLQYRPFSDDSYEKDGWFFIASEDSLHLPQFMFCKQTESNKLKSVAFPITALSFETLMQIYNGALVINFISRLSGDLLRFKQSLLVMQKENSSNE